MQKQIQNTIDKVSNSFPSLFSREDVIKLLTDLNAEMQLEVPKPQLDKEQLMDVFRDILRDKDFDNVVDSDDIEFNIGWDKKIEIDSVPIDEDFIIDSAMDALDAAWDSVINFNS